MVTSNALTNRTRAWGFIQSEANFARSRDRVTIDGSSAHELGQTLFAGTVLGMITATGKYVPQTQGAGDGSQNAVAILGEDVFNIAGDTIAPVLARDAEVRDADLGYDLSVFESGVDHRAAARASLGTVGIIVRLQNDQQVGNPAVE